MLRIWGLVVDSLEFRVRCLGLRALASTRPVRLRVSGICEVWRNLPKQVLTLLGTFLVQDAVTTLAANHDVSGTKNNLGAAIWEGVHEGRSAKMSVTSEAWKGEKKWEKQQNPPLGTTTHRRSCTWHPHLRSGRSRRLPRTSCFVLSTRVWGTFKVAWSYATRAPPKQKEYRSAASLNIMVFLTQNSWAFYIHL